MKKFSVLALAMLFVLGLATTAFAASYKSPTTTVTIDGSNALTTVANGDGADDVNDNTYKNANYTGTGAGGDIANFNNVIKSDNMKWVPTRADVTNPSTTTQRTHGEYQNNTNSCASCHQTHTAAAKDLLFKNSVYNTCTACHDGTLGFYNVFANGAAASTAGTFGGTAAGGASMHLASGAVNISAAPGGNHSEDTAGGWTEKFSCNSCHTPHGSYSGRLLHFNPNDMADVVPTQGGQKVVSEIYNGIGNLPAITTGASYVVKDSYDNLKALGFTGFYKSDNALQNGTFKYADHTATNLIVVVTQDTNTSGTKVWKVDTTPWFYEYEFDGAHTNRYYTASFWAQTKAQFKNGSYPVLDTTTAAYDDLYAADGKLMEFQPKTDGTGAINIDFQNAFAWDATAGSNLTVDLGTSGKSSWNPGVVLKTAAIARVLATKVPVIYDKTDAVSGFTYGATNPAFYSTTKYSSTDAAAIKAGTGIASGTGVGVSKFCAACHTNYFSNSGSATGMFGESAYRHNTTSDSYMCLRCHFAHGTDVEIMKDSMNRSLYTAGDDGQTAVALMGSDADAKAYLLDSNPSSALKRYTNMAVCWRCHTSSHSAGFRNTDYYKSIGMTGGTTTTASTIPNGF